MNPGVLTKWSPDSLSLAVNVLSSHSDLQVALGEISEKLQRPVTLDSLASALRRAGKPSPSQLLLKIRDPIFASGTFFRRATLEPVPEERPIPYALSGVASPPRVGTAARPQLRLVEPPNNGMEDEIPVEWDVGDVADAVGVPDTYTVTRNATRSHFQNEPAPPADRVYVEKPEVNRYTGQVIEPSGELEAHLYVPDMHHPYADKRVWELILKAGHNLRKRFSRLRVIVLGDWMDCATVSFHDKDPRRGTQLNDEIKVANEALDHLDALGADWYHFIEGNHEFRLQRYLINNAPALLDFDCLTIPELLGLPRRGWTFTPYRSFLKIGKLIATHDVGVAGPTALHRAGAAFEHTVLQGHTHRMGSHYFGNALGDTHLAMSCGWGGDLRTVEYMYRIRATRDWAHGFGEGLMMPDGCIHMHPVPIVEGRAVVFGEVIA